MKKTGLLYAIASIAIAFAAPSCKDSGKPQSTKNYKTLTIAESNTTVSNRYTASIRGEQFVDIRPQVSGVITKIAISEGAKITKGQTLFIIDQVPYQAALDVAIANVSSAKSAVATAKLNAESGKFLFDENVISDNELQVLQNTLLSAEASLALANAQETMARNDLSYTVIKSPVDGVASMINYRVGALVSSTIDNPLVSVSNNNQMYAYFSISESALLSLIEASGSTENLIKEMEDVTLILNNGHTYTHKGKIDAISGVIDSSTGSVGMRAVFDNPDQMLRDGGNGSLVITTPYNNVIVIPKVATYEIQNMTFVYKIVDGKTFATQIEVLPNDNGQEFIVSGGIEVSDIIIAEGAGLLREGTEVEVK